MNRENKTLLALSKSAIMLTTQTKLKIAIALRKQGYSTQVSYINWCDNSPIVAANEILSYLYQTDQYEIIKIVLEIAFANEDNEDVKLLLIESISDY